MIYRFYPKLKLFFLNIFGLIASFENIIIAYIVGNLTNLAISKSFANIPFFLISSIGLIIITFISQLLFNFFKADLVRTLNVSIRSKVLNGMLHNNKNNKNDLGFLVNDLKLLETNRFNAEISILISFYTLIFALGYALFLNWIVTILFLIGSFAPMLVSNFFQKPIQKSATNWSDSNDDYLNHTKSILNGKKDLFIYNKQAAAVKSNQKFVTKLEQCLFKMNLLNENSNTFISTIANLITFLFPFLVGIYLVAIGQTKLGSLFAIVQLSNSFINPILTILKERGNLSTTKEINQKAIQYLDKDLKDYPVTENRKFDQIAYKNITLFRNQRQIVKNLNLTIKKNEKIAIIGQSGSGKSTLLDFLVYQTNGKCTKIDLGGMKLSDIKNLYGYANQKPIIFNDSLKFNLTFNDPSITEKDILTVCKMLNIQNIIENQGLDYQLSQDNGNLSGGQLERINLARTILSKRPILILDEITASLDNKTAKEIHDYLLNADLTILEVIHHYNTSDLQKYDQVINLDEIN